MGAALALLIALPAAARPILASTPLPVHLTGTVRASGADAAAAEAAPLAGAAVELYVGAILRAQALSDEHGRYEISASLPADQDALVLYRARSTEWSSEWLILRETALARSLGLFSPCFFRLPLAAEMSHDVTFRRRGDEEAAAELRDCLRAGTGVSRQ